MTAEVEPYVCDEAEAREPVAYAMGVLGITMDHLLSIDDDFLVRGLDPKMAAYFLRIAAEHPEIRPTLAMAARWRTEKRDNPSRRRAEPTQVYFIQQGATGLIKIGTAGDPLARLRQLQTGSAETLRLIGVVPGGFALERSLHRRLAAHRRRGEWFAVSAESITDALGALA